jgi:2,3-dimethylmalate lyase
MMNQINNAGSISRMDNKQVLRNYLKEGKCIVAPGAFDALSAKIIEAAGFPVVYATGFGVASSAIGSPDYGIITMNDMLDTSRRMAQAVNIPVIADADTGYGNPINVYRAVREYEAAGIAGIQLEDQVFPKRCGHMNGKQVISGKEFIKKIEAAVDARKDPDFVIIARTDARAPLGLDEAIARGKAYAAAGADIIFVEAPQSEEELRKICAEIKVPLMANMVETGRTPLMPVKELQAMGFKLIIYPVSLLFAATKSMFKVARDLRANGTTGHNLDECMPFNDFTDFIGLPAYHELERKFSLKED